jgi:hypothetical protein
LTGSFADNFLEKFHHGWQVVFNWLTVEAIDAPARELAVACGNAGVGPDVFRVLQPGQVWEL